MTDLPQRIQEHLIQCHREDDDSERLLVEAKAEIARLREALEEIDSLEGSAYSLRQADDNFKEAGKVARAALNGESGNG